MTTIFPRLIYYRHEPKVRGRDGIYAETYTTLLAPSDLHATSSRHMALLHIGFSSGDIECVKCIYMCVGTFCILLYSTRDRKPRLRKGRA